MTEPKHVRIVVAAACGRLCGERRDKVPVASEVCLQRVRTAERASVPLAELRALHEAFWAAYWDAREARP